MVREPGCKCGYKQADELEKIVARELRGYSFDQDLLHQAAEEGLARKTGKNEAAHILHQAAKDLATADKKLERWYGAFEKGAIDADELTVKVKHLRERKGYLQSQLSQLQAKQKEEDQSKIDVEELLALLHNFPAIWEAATPGERREMVVNLVKAVRVYQNDKVHVEFNKL